MKKSLELAEEGFTVLALILFSGGFLALMLSGGISAGDGREHAQSYPVIQFVFLVIYFVTLCLMVREWKTLFCVLLREKYILTLLFLAFVSTVWSEAPWITLRRCFALSGTTLFGMYFAGRYNPHEKLILVGWALGLIAVSSLLLALVYPKFGIMGGPIHTGSWRGIYTHKNGLGMVMVLGISIFCLLSDSSYHQRFWAYCGLILCLMLLVLSTCKSGLLLSTLILCVVSLYRALQKNYGRMVFPFVSAVLLGGYLIFHIVANVHAPTAVTKFVSSLSTRTIESTDSDAVTQITPSGPIITPRRLLYLQTEPSVTPPAKPLSAPYTGTKIKTLTGRTQLWSAMWEMIAKRPWLGYGYGAFWMGSEGPSAYIWRVIDKWKPPTGHNGILDLWLEMGLASVLVFFFGWLTLLRATIPSISLISSPETLFPLVFIFCLVLVNLTESVLVRQNSIFWTLYVASVFGSKSLTPQGASIGLHVRRWS